MSVLHSPFPIPYWNLLVLGFRGRVAELLVRLLHGGLEVLAGLLPGLVLERHGALAHLRALVLAGVLAAAAEAGTVVMPLARVVLDRGGVGLAGTVIFLALHLAFTGGVQAATDVRLLEEERLFGIFRLRGVVAGAGEVQAAHAQTSHQATEGSGGPRGEVASIRVG